MAQTQIHLGTQAKDATLTAAKVVPGTLTNTEINAAAAIAFSKLAALSTGQVVVGNAGVATAATLGGDATISAAGVLTIANAVITGAKIAATTVLDTNLVESYIKANGTRAFSADQSMGGFKLTNLASPAAANDAASKAYVDSVAQGLDIKDSCRAVAVANVALTGEQTIDDVALVAGDRVLLVGQTNPVQNGIFIVSAGAWSRSTDMAAGSNAAGNFTFIEEGTLYAQTGWVCNQPIPNAVVGTDPLGFTQFSGATGGVTGSGTTGAIPKWTGSTALADSIMAEAGGVITVTGNMNVTGVYRVNGTQIALADLSDGATALRTNASKTILSGNTLTVASGAFLDVINGLRLNSVTVTATAAELNAVGLFVTREVPGGAINGSNTAFTLANTPIVGSEILHLNGLEQRSGAGNDYTISGLNITYLSAPQTNDTLTASYRYH